MGGNEKLGTLLYKIPDQMEHGNLSGRGQGCLRFIQNIQPVSAESVDHQGEKTLPMGLFVEGTAAVGFDDLPGWTGKPVHFFNISSHIEKAFSPEKIAVFPPVYGTADEGHVLTEIGVTLPGGKAEIASAAFRIQSCRYRNGFQQSGFAPSGKASADGGIFYPFEGQCDAL